MKAITITRHGGPEVLTVKEAPDPEPGPGEVCIDVAFAGLNFAEVMARKGLYPDAPKPPCVVGYEVSGTVRSVGNEVSEVKPGDRVAALTRFGGHASVVCVPEMQVLRIPDAMPLETAAAIPVVYLTAWHMLFRVANLQPGMHVLVHMAAGGVGTAALQLCQTVADVITCGTASPGKHDYVREQGCTHPIDYRNRDYAAEVRKLTDGRGVDIVLDPLGGGDWRKGYALLAPAGHLVAFGFANADAGETRKLLHLLRQFLAVPRFSPLRLMDDNRSVSGVNMGHLWNETEMLRNELQEVLKLWEAGAVRPHIDSVWTFEEAARAHGRLEKRKNVGKVLLQP
ncbi:MAG: alcohol dehydrogenase [Candidatus Dadabacteria bacterium]|nr:MAG: alcohol dehydrogenase [Candidatus Dadabacteria bacterium]